MKGKKFIISTLSTLTFTISAIISPFQTLNINSSATSGAFDFTKKVQEIEKLHNEVIEDYENQDYSLDSSPAIFKALFVKCTDVTMKVDGKYNSYIIDSDVDKVLNHGISRFEETVEDITKGALDIIPTVINLKDPIKVEGAFGYNDIKDNLTEEIPVEEYHSVFFLSAREGVYSTTGLNLTYTYGESYIQPADIKKELERIENNASLEEDRKEFWTCGNITHEWIHQIDIPSKYIVKDDTFPLCHDYLLEDKNGNKVDKELIKTVENGVTYLTNPANGYKWKYVEGKYPDHLGDYYEALLSGEIIDTFDGNKKKGMFPSLWKLLCAEKNLGTFTIQNTTTNNYLNAENEVDRYGASKLTAVSKFDKTSTNTQWQIVYDFTARKTGGFRIYSKKDMSELIRAEQGAAVDTAALYRLAWGAGETDVKCFSFKFIPDNNGNYQIQTTMDVFKDYVLSENAQNGIDCCKAGTNDVWRIKRVDLNSTNNTGGNDSFFSSKVQEFEKLRNEAIKDYENQDYSLDSSPAIFKALFVKCTDVTMKVDGKYNSYIIDSDVDKVLNHGISRFEETVEDITKGALDIIPTVINLKDPIKVEGAFGYNDIKDNLTEEIPVEEYHSVFFLSAREGVYSTTGLNLTYTYGESYIQPADIKKELERIENNASLEEDRKEFWTCGNITHEWIHQIDIPSKYIVKDDTFPLCHDYLLEDKNGNKVDKELIKTVENGVTYLTNPANGYKWKYVEGKYPDHLGDYYEALLSGEIIDTFDGNKKKGMFPSLWKLLCAEKNLGTFTIQNTTTNNYLNAENEVDRYGASKLTAVSKFDKTSTNTQWQIVYDFTARKTGGFRIYSQKDKGELIRAEQGAAVDTAALYRLGWGADETDVKCFSFKFIPDNNGNYQIQTTMDVFKDYVLSENAQNGIDCCKAGTNDVWRIKNINSNSNEENVTTTTKKTTTPTTTKKTTTTTTTKKTTTTTTTKKTTTTTTTKKTTTTTTTKKTTTPTTTKKTTTPTTTKKTTTTTTTKKTTTTTTTKKTTTPTTTKKTTTTTTTPATLKPTLLGDANCDGVVSIADAAAIFQCLANPDKYSLSEQGQKNADVDGKLGITPSDAIDIQRFDAKLIESF